MCTVSGSTVTKVAGGTCTINANQAGNADYLAAAQVPKNITISPASQTITFPAQTTATQPYTLNGIFAVAPNASASSGLIVTYGSSTPTICSVTGNSSIGGTVTKLLAGTCTITANQAGSASYSAAGQQARSVTISPTVPGAPTIGVGTSGDASATIAYTLNANTGGQAVTNTIATCTAAGQTTRTGTDALAPFTAITVTGLVNNVTYSCVVQADNPTGRSAASGAVGVMPSQTPTPPVINSPASTSFTVGSFGSFQVTASGFPAPTFSFTGTLPSGVTLNAAGLLSGTPALGTVANYPINITAANGNAPNGTQTFQLAVQKANQTIAFTPPATQLFSATTVPLAATASSGLAVTYATQSPGVCTVTGSFVNKISVGTCVIAADQGGNANFNAAPQVVGQFDIDMGPQAITFNAQSPATRSFAIAGTFPLSPAATASSGLPVSYQSLTVDVCTITGTTPTVTIVSVGVCTIEALQAGNANYDAAAPVQRSVGIVKADQAITFPAQPQQNFVSGGTFAINPLATTTSGLPITYNSTTIATCTVSGTTVTIVAVGTCTIAANQAGDGDWNAAPQVTRSLQIQAVVPGAPTIGVATPGNGQATIEFTPPAFNGGAAITSYTATCQPNTFTGSAAGSPVTVSGLANDTTYSCTVTANNSAGSSAPSGAVDVTPVAIDGAALWGNVCISCHGPTPAATRLNGGGTTSTVIEFVRANQPSMVLTPQVQALSPADLAAVAAYIAANTPPVDVTTAPNVPKTVSVANNLTVGTVSFTEVEIVTPPLNGTLSVVNGTEVVYTPNNGFTGVDTFTYRGRRTDPVLLLGDPRTATVNVVNGAPLLTVTKAGNGQGTVAGLLPGEGIDCGLDCTEAFATGQVVSLVATASPGSVFTGWSNGDCTGTFACDLTMDASKGVTANFALETFTLTVQKFGNGTITSNPAGINCGATCAADFNSGATVTLTAAPLAGNQFDGWSGAGCSGTGTCQVTMSAAQNVTAIFSVTAPTTFALTVSKSGTGAGTVTSSPAGINCGAACLANFNAGASVALTATASSGSVFSGWSGGGCSGTGTCNVTMNSAQSVTATFSIQTFALTVTKSGAGTGTVTSTPAGIACGATCSANFNSGVSVALAAAPSADSFFAGWSGACTGTGACNVTMDAAKSVGAQFKLNTTIPRLANISTRMQVLTGNDVLIGGFIIGGSQPKTVVVRARGPSLIPFGIANALPNPTMQLFSGQTVLATSDDWGTAANAAAITTSGFAPSSPLESAILTTLGPGAYTAVVSGVGGLTGVGIIEVFEVDKPEIPLLNISTRGQVLTGNDVMIGGFIIQGDSPQTVTVRARGPSLVPFGITNALMDPVLELFNGATPVASNDDWQTQTVPADVAAIQASGFAPADTREAVIRITLPPGAYTAIVRGKNGGTGVGIIEAFAE
ncbi:MAG: fibronectin type III domain-containing protein [Betaproteobacteria bacterium]|nr:fibronectin type III domain-containing protein [Betaproteobacteria bacterium]